MFVDKSEARLCAECGEPLELIRDYGAAGQALQCKTCGFFIEEIDLRETTLTKF